MELGLGRLRLPPAYFWAMTLPELAMALNGAFAREAGIGALARSDLDALLARYPDQMSPQRPRT